MNMKKVLKKLLFNLWPSYRQGKIVEWRVDSLRSMVRDELTLMDRKYQMLFWYLMNNPDETLDETKLRFFSMIPPATGVLRDYQLKNISILEKLKEICEKNNLIFWLEGGTLLGAIRHKGFIPWDDDIDVNMWKTDMNILKDIILNSNTDLVFRYKYNYFLNCIVPGVEPKDGSGGWVDIFPMEKINSEIYGFTETKKLINKYGQEMKQELRKKVYRETSKTEFLDMETGDKETIKNVNLIMNKYMNKLHMDDNFNCCYRSLMALNSPTGADLFFLNDVFPLNFCSFENINYMVPKNSELWLNTYYGDYLRVPLNLDPKHLKNKR